MKKRHSFLQSRHTPYILIILLILLAAATFIELRVFNRITESVNREEAINGQEYYRHYVMISDDSSSTLWNDIYEQAVEYGKEQNVLVERMGDWINSDYSAVDYMNIAMESKVDGIIVRPDGTSLMRKTIDKAQQAGIPVVTILQDESNSSRISFVGINSYQLGMTYGMQVLNCLQPDTRDVLVLMSAKDAGKELVFKQLKATVQEHAPQQQLDQLNIRSMTIRSQSTFDTEESIRDIFISEEERPDILVCMNEADSVRAYQAMIDYNCVGKVDIIGYYQSDIIMQGLLKKNIPMAIAIDTSQVSRSCIDALEEYFHMGYVSNYYSVDIDIVTKDNIEDYLSAENKGGSK